MEPVSALADRVGMIFRHNGYGDLDKDFGPEDVLSYVYAVLHSSAFRARFDRQLRVGFPRVPLNPERVLFRRLAKLGRELVDLHTFQRDPSWRAPFPVPGSNMVQRISFEIDDRVEGEGRIKINQDQYFDGVPAVVWEYQVGRFAVCHRWLSERTRRKLTFDEIADFGTIVGSIVDTLPVLEMIEEALAETPLWDVL